MISDRDKTVIDDVWCAFFDAASSGARSRPICRFNNRPSSCSRKRLHVVDPNRAPEHDQEIGLADQGIVKVRSRGVTVGDGPSGLVEDRTHQTQVLERYMPYGES